MSELPERKTLKEILPKLKLKAMNAEKSFVQMANTITSNLIDLQKETMQIMEKAKAESPKREWVLILLAYVNSVQNSTNVLINNANSAIQDMKIYIETLEMYSSELDKSFWGAIDKEVEKRQKQQEKQMKKEPSYRT